MAEITFRPLLTRWPKPETPARERRSQGWDFHKGIKGWIDHLERELVHLKICEALVEVDADPVHFKKWGGLFADARPKSPRVMLTFDLPDVGPMVYACDSYTHFEDNLHAIGLTLERLRLVDSYGATTGHQQYQGFKRLPSAGGSTVEREWTPSDAARVVVNANPLFQGFDESMRASVSEALLRGQVESAKSIVLAAQRATHPDTGGDADRFANVQRARDVLVKHFNGKW